MAGELPEQPGCSNPDVVRARVMSFGPQPETGSCPGLFTWGHVITVSFYLFIYFFLTTS